MKTKIIEASNGQNWGKFMLGRLDSHEWAARSQIERSPLAFGLDDHPGVPLIQACGWTHKHIWVLDLQTGEGAWFKPGGYPKADLEKHAIWVCLLFEPFLEWLYEQDLTHLDDLPALVELPDAPAGLYGHRRPGPQVREAALDLVNTRWWHRCEDGPGGCHAVSERALVAVYDALGIPYDLYQHVETHGPEDEPDPGPPPNHVVCPDCGDDPQDWTSHLEGCPRIGTVGQTPPFEDGPWQIRPPWDFTNKTEIDWWRRNIAYCVIQCMAGRMRLVNGGLDVLTQSQVDAAREMIPQHPYVFEEIAVYP